jgi:chitodextrinase
MGVTGYKVFRNSSAVGTTGGTMYQDNGLQAATKYSYFVKAYDAAGNTSASSNTVSATTKRK